MSKILSDPRSPRRAADSAAGSQRRVVGARAEDAAAVHLAQIGLAILGRNVRVGRAEIDLLARDGAVIVVVEVRTRGASAYQRALDSIDRRKQARLRAAGARLWRERFLHDPSIERMRFDAAAVTFLPDGSALVEHVRAAF